MPPSPAMRCSPGRVPRVDNHKRGRSFESGILLKPRDDDLALFNEVQSRERDNFLLQSSDDFEDTFTNKLRHFSDHKLGINIPTRGESSDLLHAEEEKNDYEWLLTPPDTPLFPSLDEETPEVNLAQRGRPRTQPISISRSSTMEKSHRSSRGSASPNRFSPSPRSSHSPFEARNRASPTPSSSPPTSLRPTSATRRLSPPSRKPATPVPRASTPTPRRSSTSSNGTTGPTTGPVKTSRGNSVSPKVIAWQSNIPGFSTEVPPNLRTSLADRPASYVRGSSPASRSSRQSMSPTASRSICSSHSKGSVASSVDDDVESTPSVIVGSGSRKVGGFSNNKGLVSKKPSRTVSSSSAPKRSFDLALRQMDNRKAPQNMFRPLLSSVPSSSFHGGITSSAPRTIISRNSSITTSSNASSGLATSGVHDHETCRDGVTTARVNVQECSNNDDEVFMLEKGENEAFDELDHDNAISVVFDDFKNDSEKGMLVCSRCGCGYDLIGGVENDENLCADCVKLYSRLSIVDRGVEMGVVESREVTGKVKAQSGQHEDGQSTYGEPIWKFLPESSLSRSQSEECAPKQVGDDTVDFSNSKLDFSGSKVESSDSKVHSSGSKVDSLSSNVDSLSLKVDSSGSTFDFSNSKGDILNPNVDFSGSKVDSLEGAGISILLKRSSSIKGPVVRNTNFSASSISYDDFSYVRDSTNSVRSMSVSSSIDFGPVRQTDTRFNRQLSSTKSEMENYKFDLGSSYSGTSSHAFHTSSLGTSIENDENTLQTVLNQMHVDSGESFVDALLQKVEDSGVDTCALQTCTFEEGTTPNLCVGNTDIAEVPLESISEGELKCDDSRSSKSSIDELRDSCVTMVIDKDVAVQLEDYDSSNHENNIIEESMVLVGPRRGLNGRSLTLEEATDTILFCSSIVHKLAYEAATIAIDNQNPPNPVDKNTPWPLVPAVQKATTRLDKNEFQKQNTTKRSSNSQKSRHKKVAEPHTTKSPNSPYTDQPKTRIIGVRDSSNLESKKPPILESKCNCTIM